MSEPSLAKTIALFPIAIIIGLTGLHFYLLDGLHGWFFSTGFEEDTVYATGYSDAAFRHVRKGMTIDHVRSLIGLPLHEVWIYRNTNICCAEIGFTNNQVDMIEGEYEPFKRVKAGMYPADVARIVGKPVRKSLVFSKSPGSKSYRIRTVLFLNDRVSEVRSEFYMD